MKFDVKTRKSNAIRLSDFAYIEEVMCPYHQKLPVPQGRIRKYEDFSAKIDFDPMCRGT